MHKERLISVQLGVLAGLGAIGSAAIHLFVPALPLIAVDFGASDASVQLLVSYYLAGVGIGQLAGGIISDELGRKPIIFTGVAIFLLASIYLPLCNSIRELIIARVFQALGAGMTLAVTRAIISDQSTAQSLPGRVAVMSSVVLISPALSPVVGGAVAEFGSWRAIAYLLVAVTLMLGAAFVWFVPETRPSENNPATRRLSKYLNVAKSLLFWRYSIAVALCSTAMFAFLAVSPFIFRQEYALLPSQAGTVYFLIALSAIVGTRTVALFERRRGAFRAGLLCSIIGALLMVALHLVQLESLLTIVVPMAIIAAGVGLASPSGLAGILRSAAGMPGTAASLAGAIQMLASGVMTTALAKVEMESGFQLSIAVLGLLILARMIAPGGRVADHVD